MKVNAILMITAASAVLAAPVPDNAQPTPSAVPAAVNAYASYEDYTYKQYSSYGSYGNATPPPPPQPTTYTAYSSYGTYKRVADWIKSKLE
ncbi:hypothetical protein CkaCkLH20_05503 [Colletotrichum karsti]|uniref:Uncharacterized protein n=1 Tax=Colletotrichum karsti TaxID=1095194 RepID=A0A9P6I7M0_9PEZI|nr:uncharacterized protein CkaCkLH20_05503 [Colletotrichum karsti]KAF9877237.1 hypothetical protein CkaCkLH20_05503 [Colletotrichum karsti]